MVAGPRGPGGQVRATARELARTLRALGSSEIGVLVGLHPEAGSELSEWRMIFIRACIEMMARMSLALRFLGRVDPACGDLAARMDRARLGFTNDPEACRLEILAIADDLEAYVLLRGVSA